MLSNQQEVDEHQTEASMTYKPFDSARVVPFRDRVFGHANVTVRHLKEAFDGDEWHNIDDVDAVRLCLVMFVEFVLLGREHKNNAHVHLLALVEDLDAFNQFPWGSYTWSVLYKSIRNAAWIHYRHVNVSDGAGEGGGKVGKLEKLKKKTWVIEILPKIHIWFSKVNDNIVPMALMWHVKIRFARESYENLFGGFDHDFQSETRQLELTKVEQNQYWWVESERYFEAHRLLFRPNDLPPPKPIKNRIPRKPERTNIMPISTTLWDNVAKEIAELKDRNNNWSGFGEVDLKVLVTRLANLESRMNGYDMNKNGGYCDRDIRMDSGVGMQDHSKVVTDTRMDTVVRMDT
ncbi:phospholipase-like protein, partial [Tanacetum coccineum]